MTTFQEMQACCAASGCCRPGTRSGWCGRPSAKAGAMRRHPGRDAGLRRLHRGGRGVERSEPQPEPEPQPQPKPQSQPQSQPQLRRVRLPDAAGARHPRPVARERGAARPPAGLDRPAARRCLRRRAELRRECLELLRKQVALATPAEAGRKEEILRQRELELSDYLRPLSADELGGFDETITLFLMVARHLRGGRAALQGALRRGRARASWSRGCGRSWPTRRTPPTRATTRSSRSRSPTSSRGCCRSTRASPSLFRSAQRVAENREWAGIHYASDTRAGKQLARMFTPILEVALQEQMLEARAEWL